jgi:hypothetical protein
MLGSWSTEDVYLSLAGQAFWGKHCIGAVREVLGVKDASGPVWESHSANTWCRLQTNPGRQWQRVGCIVLMSRDRYQHVPCERGGLAGCRAQVCLPTWSWVPVHHTSPRHFLLCSAATTPLNHSRVFTLARLFLLPFFRHPAFTASCGHCSLGVGVESPSVVL